MQKLDFKPYIPMPVCLLGTSLDGQDNFMAAAWVTHVDSNPPLIAVGLGKNRRTSKAIEANGGFSINVPGTTLMPATDYAGMASGNNTSKANLFQTFRGQQVDVPLIRDAAMCLECKLSQTVNLPAHNLYIGEIVAAWADEACLSDGKPDLKKMDVFFLSMPDNRYWSIGEDIGQAWNPQNKKAFGEAAKP